MCNISSSLKNLFEVFRKQIPNKKLLNSKCDNAKHSKAESQASKIEVRQKIKQLKVVNQWDEIETDESIDKVCFINWVDYNDYFSFVQINDNTCKIYGWDHYKYIYKREGNLISEIRKQILFGLIRTSRRKDSNPINLNDMPSDFFIDTIINDRKMVENVRAFDVKLATSEKESETLINMNDYLNNYIAERIKSS